MTTPLDPRGHALERDVPAAERHTRGQYFTPEPLIDFVFDRLEDVGAAPSDGAVVLDPACGSGRFLAAARARWGRLRLRGHETDPAALQLAHDALPDAAIDARSFLDVPPRGDVDLVIGNPPYLRSRGAKRDLYVAFVERALDHLRPGGTLALVLSNAWLNVGYGADVRRALRSGSEVLWIVESGAERWFPGAKVHTMVLIARRTRSPSPSVPVRLAATEAPLPAPPTVRRAVPQSRLPDAPWGALLRASDAFLAARERLEPLGARHTVRRGFTTNDNGYFYPPPNRLPGIEASALAPVFRSPKRVRSVRAIAEQLPDRVFLGGRADGPGAAAWVDAHHPEDPPRLKTRVAARQFLLKGYAARFRQPLFDVPVLCDQQLYAVEPTGPDGPPEALAAVLNSTWMHLSLEYAGRVNFGDGVLWLGLKDARAELRIPTPTDPASLRALADAFAALPTGDVPSVPELYDHPRWGPAMQRLDAVVGGLLGLDPAAIRALQDELVQRCRIRCG